VREKVPPIKSDREFSEDIKKTQNMIGSGALLHGVEKVVGRLK